MTEQQELQQRIEVKARQEQGKKSKVKKKCKQDIDTGEPHQAEDITTELPPQTPTMPRGNRGQRNDEGSDDERQDQRNQDKIRGSILVT